MKLNFPELKRRVAPFATLQTRFAPSPSGYLHLGHVAHAMFVWGLSRELGGNIALRMEDHDRNRSKSIFAQQILDDLHWLGFDSEKHDIYVQSAHTATYESALAKLSSQGLLYRCECSRADIKSRQNLRGEAIEGEALRYDGFCRDKQVPLSQATSLRIKTSRDKTLDFWDAYRGELSVDLSEGLADFALVDRLGFFTYQLAVVVDDLQQGINLIIRGEDILPSTLAQLYLRSCLSPQESAPVFVHHPLMYQTPKSMNKLSKKNSDESIKSFRSSGCEPVDLFQMVAKRMGFSFDAKKTDLKDLGLFW